MKVTELKEKVTNVTYKDIFDSNTTTEKLTIKLSPEMRIDKENFYIDIEKIIKENNIEIVYESMPDKESGQYIKDDKKIIVNMNHSKNRQRFTLAHEFAHYLLGHDNSYRSEKAEKYINYQALSSEREANNIAANLLMPKVMISALFEKYLEENGLTQSKIVNNKEKEKLYEFISEKLKVSKASVGFRLLNLGII